MRRSDRIRRGDPGGRPLQAGRHKTGPYESSHSERPSDSGEKLSNRVNCWNSW